MQPVENKLQVLTGLVKVLIPCLSLPESQFNATLKMGLPQQQSKEKDFFWIPKYIYTLVNPASRLEVTFLIEKLSKKNFSKKSHSLVFSFRKNNFSKNVLSFNQEIKVFEKSNLSSKVLKRIFVHSSCIQRLEVTKTSVAFFRAYKPFCEERISIAQFPMNDPEKARLSISFEQKLYRIPLFQHHEQLIKERLQIITPVVTVPFSPLFINFVSKKLRIKKEKKPRRNPDEECHNPDFATF